ncbi:MAG: sterol desaturase family protein [Cyclobacteriaceae bacterium]
MDSFLLFFETMPTWQRLAWVVTCLVVCWILEGNYPLARHSYSKLKHDGVNLVFLAFTFVINLLFGVFTVGIFVWMASNQIGLLHFVDWPVWVELLIAVMFLDFVAQYVVHYLLHRVKWMWKFHMIHHSDTKVDATTGTRHHPGDYFLREVFALIAIVILGAPIAFYLFYRFCTIFFTYTSHANINMPRWLDKTLSLVFITPNMHKFHHHFERPWTDTNFGNIFSFWDRLFGTMVYDDPRKIKYGLDVVDETRDEDISYQLGLPLDKTVKTDY